MQRDEQQLGSGAVITCYQAGELTGHNVTNFRKERVFPNER